MTAKIKIGQFAATILKVFHSAGSTEGRTVGLHAKKKLLTAKGVLVYRGLFGNTSCLVLLSDPLL